MHICPKCGTAEGTKNFIGPFCADCYYFRISMPDEIRVDGCKRCRKIKLHGKWVPYSEEKLKKFVESKFKGEFSSAEFFLDEKAAVFKVAREGADAEIRKHVNFEVVGGICPECNKQAGGYFEAIIQLRGNPARIEKYFHIFDKRVTERGSFVSKIIECKEGLDLYVGNTQILLAIIKELGLEHKISTTLAGQKQGKRLYRTTFSIRL